MQRILISLSFLSVLAACSSVNSSGAQRIGENEYTVTASSTGIGEQSVQARTRALEDANSFCSKFNGGYAEVYNEELKKGEYASAIIYFRCKK